MVLPLALPQGLRPVLPLPRRASPSTKLPQNFHQGPLLGQLATQLAHPFLFPLGT